MLSILKIPCCEIVRTEEEIIQGMMRKTLFFLSVTSNSLPDCESNPKIEPPHVFVLRLGQNKSTGLILSQKFRY